MFGDVWSLGFRAWGLGIGFAVWRVCFLLKGGWGCGCASRGLVFVFSACVVSTAFFGVHTLNRKGGLKTTASRASGFREVWGSGLAFSSLEERRVSAFGCL